MRELNPLAHYPWLASAWEPLIRTYEADRVAHALLLHGPAGIGKATLARHYAQRLLCSVPGPQACGQCPSCLLYHSESHPDFHWLQPEAEGKPIKIDSVRKLIQDLHLTPQFSTYRTLIINQAEQLNTHAVNALLKSLEEPSDRTVWILVTERPSRLPATVLSRCQKASVKAPARSEMTQWLQKQAPAADANALLSAASGSPLRALGLLGSDIIARRQRRFEAFVGLFSHRHDPVEIAEQWHNDALAETLDWMLDWVGDLIRLKMTGSLARLSNPDFGPVFSTLVDRLDAPSLLEMRDHVQEARNAVGGPSNRQLLIEILLIRWSHLSRRPR